MHADAMKHSAASAKDSIAITIVTLDGHLGRSIERVQSRLQADIPNLALSIHPASNWENDETALQRCHTDIASADIIVCTMLFMEPHIQAVLPALTARAPHCDAIVGAMSDNQIVRLTRMGRLDMSREMRGPMALLKKLRKRGKPAADGETEPGTKDAGQNGKSQMKTLRMLPKILKYVPGSAQDLRVYFLVLQCWLAGSEVNITNLIRLMIRRYASGERESLRNCVKDGELIEYPETGLYHPALAHRVTDQLSALPPVPALTGTVGLLLMRSYVLAENTRHYDAVITAFESRGLRVIPAFASGLDARPALDSYFSKDGKASVDCIVSLTGFSLVGGPAYHDANAARVALESMDVPYIVAHPSEFQSLEQWQESSRGLTPIETTLMVAIPELDGATSPMLFAGHDSGGKKSEADKLPVADRVERLADRALKLVSMKLRARADRQLGIVIFNFPPNAGAMGTAAHLSVFESLFNTLQRLDSEGYTVEVPASVDDLRERLLNGNATQHGSDANVIAKISTDTHVRNTPWLEDIEAQWGPAPGTQLSNGQEILVLGLKLGNITIGVQPGFGHEGDPMRLLFENGTAPTHAFSAFYRYLQKDVGVDALLHFGTHGALEFMSGKHAGLSGDCWPERLLGDTPNFYLYAANNPSEASIAKRRSAATLISYLTPAITEAGLYRGLQDIKASLTQWQQLSDRTGDEALELVDLLREQVEEFEMLENVDWSASTLETNIKGLQTQLTEIEHELIPSGMHVIGEAPALEERVDLLHAYQNAADGDTPAHEDIRELLIATPSEPSTPDDDAETDTWQNTLIEMDRHLTSDAELAALIHALDAGFISPVAGGDVLHNKETLPTGRNIHGFDPLRLPTPLALRSGARKAELLLERYQRDSGTLPRSVAFVLWGSDNMKSQGVPIAQAMALLGAEPRLDSYGKLCGAKLKPLDELGRARIDVMITLSGVFRDLMPLQTRMLAEAAFLAASADEPLELNHVRTNALTYQQKTGCTLETAALRVFSNADGAYGANVNLLIDSGAWTEESELADTYANRKCFAFGSDGESERQPELMEHMLGDVDLACQNLESVELGVTQLDYYFDTLGGINSLAKRVRGESVPTYILDPTRGEGSVRTLQEQVALETRSRMLNPTWYEGQLKHGYEGVRSIESSVTNTLGWSATTGQVSPWVYNQMARTFVLDEAMRERLASLNPTASARMANRLIEAHERNYWSPDDDVLQALYDAGDELEDRLEGITPGAAA